MKTLKKRSHIRLVDKAGCRETMIHPQRKQLQEAQYKVLEIQSVNYALVASSKTSRVGSSFQGESIV